MKCPSIVLSKFERFWGSKKVFIIVLMTFRMSFKYAAFRWEVRKKEREKSSLVKKLTVGKYTDTQTTLIQCDKITEK